MMKFAISLYLSIVFFVSACSTEQSHRDQAATTSATAGYIFSANSTLLKALSSEGVSIMRLGDQLTLIIPSQRLFKGYSVLLSESGNEILHDIVQLLGPMNKVKMSISAYAQAPMQSDKDLFLTEKQAQTVGNYLWDHGVDARMIYTIGYGGGHPVDYQPDVGLNNLLSDPVNYRVEITLKEYVN